MSQLPVEPDLESQQVPSKPVLRDDPKFASTKIAFIQYLVVGVFLFLITAFWDLQVQNPEFYNERAERNRIKSLPILAPRGKILDRDGRVLVDNHSSFSLILSRENLKLEHLKEIAAGLNLDYQDLKTRVDRYSNRPKYEPIVIKEELTPADLAFVEAHRDPEFFPELEIIHAQKRLYPQNGFAAHVIGYTGEVSEAELDTPEFARYDPGDVVGKFGIERQYNERLMGVDGERQVVVDNRGREREVLGIKEARPGRNLQLTLDLDLQAVAELAMEGRKGAVVALDPRTGEVLAMVSRPTFDPNKFAVRIKAADWKDLTSNPDKPLLNRAIQAQLAPGSTFKPIVAIAALQDGSVDEEFSVRCGGGASFYGRYFKCWEKKGHGTVSLHKGIAQSCDVYFYTIGNRIGIDKIAFYSEMAGLGRRTGIDLPHETEGVVPSTRWKARNFRQKWYPGETISVAIGQGALTVSPLQLAAAEGGMALSGVWHRPHLVKDAKLPPPNRWSLTPEHVQAVVDGMYAVVNDGGTGGRARIPGIEVCGKTGTSQLASNQFLQGKTAAHLKDNAWFIGFAPRHNPEIVVTALFENGEHGYLAGPIVRDVIKAYFDKKARTVSQQRPKPPVIALGPGNARPLSADPRPPAP
ncbi:MAG: penicillin-binding protein 2 [Bryobacterales bacterium]|nr:penicillin-binding protein 2 [Bryobacterales bacterium]